MISEVILLYVGVIGAITALFHLRGIPFIGTYLSTFVAILLMYPAVWHVRFRNLPVVFFEKTLSQFLRSLKLFALTALAIFPLFLLLAHFYQTLIFGLRFDPRGFSWSWENVAVQLVLVALPEEFFFRGYLQTMLATRFSKRFRLFGLKFLEAPVALPLTSLLFALSHSVITFRWWHFAIFFPSLVFGWLRDRTNGLAAPILFHALSNLVLNQIGSFLPMTIRVVYEDADLLIVEKPAGIPTQPLTSPYTPSLVRRGTGGGRPPTLAHLVAKSFPEIKSVGGPDWGAVHRLDRETSGLVVFARNQKTYNALREAFSKNEVEKEYTALVERRVDEPGKIDWPVGPDPRSSKRVKVYRNIAEARRNKAQEAVTIYEPITSGETSLLKILIKTGRRHQIRVHLATMGHPIVGDSLYGGPEAERLHLHASRLKLRHPPSPSLGPEDRWVEASSPAPFSGSPRSTR